VFFEQPSPTSTAILFSLPAPPLHAPRGGSSVAAAIASIQSPAPWYVYFYDLDCFWIRLDLIFWIVRMFLYFQS